MTEENMVKILIRLTQARIDGARSCMDEKALHIAQMELEELYRMKQEILEEVT